MSTNHVVDGRDNILYILGHEGCLQTAFFSSCLELFWPVIPQIIVAKVPTVCFHAL